MATTADPGHAPAQAGLAAVDLRTEAAGENFPVASWLLSPRVRPHVMAFYNYVRAADNIADSGTLTPSEKLAGLDAYDRGLREPGPEAPAEARTLAESVAATGVGQEEALKLIAAFRQDVTKLRYTDFEDLLGYCRLSADPVGRFLLKLHDEDPAIFPASDGLCSALQVLNHVQDCKADYENLDRVYMPLWWLEAEGLDVTALAGRSMDVRLRRVLHRVLDATDELLARARALPGGIRDQRMRMEAAAIVALAIELSARLRDGDPLAGRVALSKVGKLAVGLRGAIGAFRG